MRWIYENPLHYRTKAVVGGLNKRKRIALLQGTSTLKNDLGLTSLRGAKARYG